MKTITRTIMGSALQSALLLGIRPQILPFTTLNEKFGVLADAELNEGEVPHLGYFAIGNGGHRNRVGGDGTPYSTPHHRVSSHAALYRHLPFVLRPVDNDLSVSERAQYGMRVLETHNNLRYWAYYLKRINLADVLPVIEHTVVNGDNDISSPYEFTMANLNPTPPEVPNDGVITTSGNYLSVSSILKLLFTAKDVLELIEACRIKYDNEAYAVISEIGLVSGVDRLATVQGSGNQSFNMMEVACAQICSFITTDHRVAFTNSGFEQNIELGATEPLLSATDVVTAGVLRN